MSYAVLYKPWDDTPEKPEKVMTFIPMRWQSSFEFG